jgi:FkbM family methyltransferase
MLACDARDQVACTAAALGWRTFEQPMPAVMRALLASTGPGMFVDVGANTGFYSLLALAVSPHSTVVAYEPLAAVRTVLLKNIRLNRVALRTRSRVRVSACALSDEAGPARLFLPDQGHGLLETSASLSAVFKGSAAGYDIVERTTLDDDLKAARTVTFIKVDAEGHDLQVLSGARGLLLRARPIVFVEVLLGADEAGLTSLLRQAGYVDLVMRPAGIAGPSREVRHDTFGWNHVWLPEERAANHMETVMASVGDMRTATEHAPVFSDRS